MGARGIVFAAASQAKTEGKTCDQIYQRSAAVVAMPVRGILMMTVGSTIGPMTPARTFAYCQPTFRGEPRKVGFHAGRGSRHVGNEVSTQTHCIRGACLPFRIGALGACTVRPTSKATGKQCKRASQLENTHVVTSALRVILRHSAFTSASLFNLKI